MRGAVKKVLMGLLTVFMVCLIVSTSTTTVTAAAYWGTLKAGDEMKWNSIYGSAEISVQSVEGDTITVEYDQVTITESADEYPSSLSPWIVPKSDLSGSTQNYEWQGTSYKAYYTKNEFADGSMGERWRDFDTGILFEDRFTDADGSVTTEAQLVSCTADLAAATGGGGGGCLGTLFIALFSVTTVVSYSLLWKKKKR